MERPPYGSADWIVCLRTREVSVLHGRRHEKLRDKEAVRFHYDVPVEFYRLWLDSRLMYSCGYYQNDDDGLEQAQTQKLEYLCRKLHLKPGDRVLEIGCGWGGFALYAAQAHGALVHGITLSRREGRGGESTHQRGPLVQTLPHRGA